MAQNTVHPPAGPSIPLNLREILDYFITKPVSIVAPLFSQPPKNVYEISLFIIFEPVQADT